MKVFIVHAHPEPKSFNGALTGRAIKTLNGAGHDVVVSDLYQMNWNPRTSRENFLTTANPDFFKQQIEEDFATTNNGFAPDIQQELDKLLTSDVLILQFPLYWFSVPAILKGWFDRVFALGKAYGYTNMLDTGFLAGHRAMVSVTVGGNQALYTNDKNGLGDLNDILYPINFGLRFVGFDVLPPFITWAPNQVTYEERQQVLDRYESRLNKLLTIEPINFRERVTQVEVKV